MSHSHALYQEHKPQIVFRRGEASHLSCCTRGAPTRRSAAPRSSPSSRSYRPPPPSRPHCRRRRRCINKTPKPSLEGWHKKFVKESKVRYRMVGTVWEAEVTRLHRGCAGWSARVPPQHRRRGAPLRCALVGREKDSKKRFGRPRTRRSRGARAPDRTAVQRMERYIWPLIKLH